jgi:diguanylate cyclase (GGDEF)-like protein
VGDDVLKRFAKLLQSQVRQSDLVGRWGGEEFVVLVLQADSVDLAALAGKLRRAVAKADLSNVGTITCSIGVADSQPHDDFDSLLKRADDALYDAKSQGRNRVVVSA